MSWNGEAIQRGFNFTGSNLTSPSGNITLASGVLTAGGGVAAGLSGGLCVIVKKVALAALDTGGGILSWLNPEGVAIFVHRLMLNVTTKTTGACTANFGQASGATTSNDGLIDGVDLNAATGVFDNTADAGTNGKPGVAVPAGEYITGSKESGAAAALVGFAYIHYTLQ